MNTDIKSSELPNINSINKDNTNKSNDPRSLKNKPECEKNELINWKEAKLDINREDLERIWTETYQVAIKLVIERVVINSQIKESQRLMNTYMPAVFNICDLAIQEYTKYLKANRPMILDCLEDYNRTE